MRKQKNISVSWRDAGGDDGVSDEWQRDLGKEE